jgi:hypothetical protein
LIESLSYHPAVYDAADWLMCIYHILTGQMYMNVCRSRFKLHAKFFVYLGLCHYPTAPPGSPTTHLLPLTAMAVARFGMVATHGGVGMADLKGEHCWACC